MRRWPLGLCVFYYSTLAATGKSDGSVQVINRVNLEVLIRPNENLFLPLVPGVQIVELATTPQLLVRALLSVVGPESDLESEGHTGSSSVTWSGLGFYFSQDPNTWPNPLTILVTVEDGRGAIEELSRFQIQQTHVGRVRLAARHNLRLLELNPHIAWGFYFTMGLWLDPWKAELPTLPSEVLPARDKFGRPPGTGITAHKSALARLMEGESKERNFYQWAIDYKEETGTDPDLKKTGARELYRKSVWAVYKKQTGK